MTAGIDRAIAPDAIRIVPPTIAYVRKADISSDVFDATIKQNATRAKISMKLPSDTKIIDKHPIG